MATLASACEMASALRPNAFSRDILTAWVNEVEGIIQTEVLLRGRGEIITYDYGENSNSEMLVPPPHDKLYYLYLCAMIDFANGEADRYQNSMAMFNAALDEYTVWYDLHRDD